MIKGSTKVFGIFGRPIEHTLSPFIHNSLAECIGEDTVYTAFHVGDNLEKAVEGAFAMGVDGLNITVPFKEDVMKSLVSLDKTAETIGAVNTLVKTPDGYKGYNTDAYGIKKALEEYIKISGRDAVILGAGGAARAVIYTCMTSGCNRVYILNRTLEKAQSLADEMNRKLGRDGQAIAVKDADSIDSDMYILIQCTSLGLKEGDSLLIEDDSLYERAAFGYDLIYNPEETPFTKKLAEVGVSDDNGLSMLLFQAVKSHELWTGKEIPEEAVKKVYAKLRKKVYGNNIVLTGFMGSGKTSVGKALASLTGKMFIDMDEAIVRAAGMSINEIFEKYGEESFRRLEHDMLVEYSLDKYDSIISTGGGIVVREDNIPYLKEMGKVFYLDASDETIYERIKDDNERPLMRGCDRDEALKRIASLKAKRLFEYAKALDVRVDTEGKNASEIAEIIASYM